MHVQSWGNGCTRYILTQLRVNFRVLAGEPPQIKHGAVEISHNPDQKWQHKKLVADVESHASTVSLLESREYRYINNNNKQEVHVTVALTELQVFTPLSVTDPVSRSQQHQAVVAVKNKKIISVNFDDLPGLLQTTLKCPVLHCSACKHPS